MDPSSEHHTFSAVQPGVTGHAATNLELFTGALQICIGKARRNIRQLADEPKSCSLAADGNFFAFPETFFEIGNWTSSFFTGMALTAFEITGDDELLRQVRRLESVYREKVFTHGMDTMHDLGFLYSLYSVAMHRITGEEGHRRTALKAADILANRFIPQGGFIQAWGRMDDPDSEYTGVAIIDCLMNLPLLFWASRELGTRTHADVALRHAATTLALFVRNDDSVYHAFRFDPITGTPVGGDNYCGLGVESHWARGAAWAFYGFALAFRHSGDTRFRNASRRIATRFIQLLDDDVVPVWDFHLHDGQKRLRDSSAAAIAACGLQELLVHLPGESAFASAADRLLHALCTRYVDTNAHCPGVLRNAQAGDGVGRARNVYSAWGDYFFMEALARRLHDFDPYW